MSHPSTVMPSKRNDYEIHGLPVLQDNIIWIWVEDDQAVVIDPAISEPVLTWLKAKGLNLVSVLQTHHHQDHIGGTESLLKQWPSASVIACKADLHRIPFQTISVKDGDEYFLMGSTLKVVEVVGHTSAHVAYYLSEKSNTPALFCGDTLFGAGCGRLFEGTAENMYNSLQRLNLFPTNTNIYCAHEYTESNLRWAASLQPEDLLIKQRLEKVIKNRQEGLLSLPSSLQEERETNLFIRAKSLEEFATLRKDKDNWKG